MTSIMVDIAIVVRLLIDLAFSSFASAIVAGCSSFWANRGEVCGAGVVAGEVTGAGACGRHCLRGLLSQERCHGEREEEERSQRPNGRAKYPSHEKFPVERCPESGRVAPHPPPRSPEYLSSCRSNPSSPSSVPP